MAILRKAMIFQKTPPSRVFERVVLTAAEAGTEYN
jgi:hypothetical protein